MSLLSKKIPLSVSECPEISQDKVEESCTRLQIPSLNHNSSQGRNFIHPQKNSEFIHLSFSVPGSDIHFTSGVISNSVPEIATSQFDSKDN